MKTLRRLIATAFAAIAICHPEAMALDMYPVRIDGMWGYADPDGKILVNPVFDNAYDFADGMAPVCIDGRWGYIDENREIAIRPAFDGAMPFSEGLASVRIGDRWTIVDRRGVPVSENAIFESAPAEFHYSRAIVHINGHFGYINRSGEQCIPAIYESAQDFSCGLALVGIHDHNLDCTIRTFIDTDGKTTLTPEGYEWIDSFYEGFAAVSNGHYGFIDIEGKEVIPCTWKHSSRFSEGIAAVCDNNDKWSFIDRSGKVIFEPEYTSVLADPNISCVNASFNRDGESHTAIMTVDGNSPVAYVEKDGKWGLFNKKKVKEVVKPAYDWIVSYGEIYELKNAETKSYATPSGKIFDSYSKACNALTAEASFADFAKKRIEPAINTWQRKGRYEKSSDYIARVNNDTRRQMIEQMAVEAEIDFITRYAPYVRLDYKLSDYDADNEVFLIETPRGNLLVPVPLSEAPEFERQFDITIKTPAFGIENDRLDLAEVKFRMPDGKEFLYLNSATVNFAAADIDYQFEPFVVEKTTQPKGQQNISTVRMSVGKSDVDINIPETGTSQPEIFAVIIGNENYAKAQNVDYAAADATIFAEYCRSTLGLPDDNVRYYPDATYLNMLDALTDIRNIARAYKGELDIIFYYAGHGLQDDATRAPHLMPVDADGTRPDHCLPTSKLYSELASTDARSITVFLDACFSGSQRGEGMISKARGVRRRVRSDAPQGRMVVFSAASGDETAYPYREKGHGLFTYFLLKKLQESRGELTLGELSDYISENVSRQSTVSNRRSQTPTASASTAIGSEWRTRTLK